MRKLILCSCMKSLSSHFLSNYRIFFFNYAVPQLARCCITVTSYLPNKVPELKYLGAENILGFILIKMAFLVNEVIMTFT